MGEMQSKLLEINNLEVEFSTRQGTVKILDKISLNISEGETVAVVGESGSGKSVSVLSILQLFEKTGKISSGEIFFNKKNLIKLSNNDIRKIRGKEISMIFQDPMSSLDPVYTIGNQIIEAIKVHEKLSKKEYRKRAIELLKLVGIPDPEERLNSYPHELSGGQRQRVMIAIAIACNPKIIIADEPTTALDVTVQAQIMQLLKDIQTKFGTAIILVTHDLGIVAEMADRVVVVYAGQIVEKTDVESLFRNPSHPYTEALLKSAPSIHTDRNKLLNAISGNVPNLFEIPNGCRFHPRCPYVQEICKSTEPPLYETENGILSKCWKHDKKILNSFTFQQQENMKLEISLKSNEKKEKSILLNVKELKKDFPIKKGIFLKTVGHIKAVDYVSFSIYEGETLGLVGESGCGKSTTGRLIMGLIEPTQGDIEFLGNNINQISRKKMREIRKDIQLVFQDPYSSLNPRLRVKDIIAEPLEIHKIVSKHELEEKVIELLNTVGLSKNDMNKFPHQFSGGQRQRIGIARALATEPKLLICDEAVSALDVSVQAQILNLLRNLQLKFNLSYLFISHDLNVVRYISDRIAVMYLGEIVEIADCETLFNNPLHPYTQILISSIPNMDINKQREKVLIKGDIPSPSNPPSGCKFHTRCPFATEKCINEKPLLKNIGSDHSIACHLY